MKPDLSNEYFTKVVPSLDTIEIDSRYIDAKTVECERLSINGKKLETIINEEKLQPSDLVGREIIGEDDYYVLWDDNGQPIDMKLPEESCTFPRLCTGIKKWTWDISKATSVDFYRCINLEYFKSDLSALKIGNWKFEQIPSLRYFCGDLSSLENGDGMFAEASNLRTFQTKENSNEINLPSLTNGYRMFSNCSLLGKNEDDTITGYTFNLPLLTNGSWMFRNSYNGIKKSTFNMPNLVSAGAMFAQTGIEEFEASVELLQNGESMFLWVPLKKFSSQLPSLINGSNMFNVGKLDKPSVENIINCLRTTNVLTTTAILDLGIDKTLATDSELLEFLQISEGVAQSITIVPPVRTLEDGTVVGGGTWTVNLTWN